MTSNESSTEGMLFAPAEKVKDRELLEKQAHYFQEKLGRLSDLRTSLERLGAKQDAIYNLVKEYSLADENKPYFLSEEFAAKYASENPQELDSQKVVDQMYQFVEILTGKDHTDYHSAENGQLPHLLLVPDTDQGSANYYSLSIQAGENFVLPIIRISNEIADNIIKNRKADQGGRFHV